MEKKVYHLANCGTCQRIIRDLGIGEEFKYQNIKQEKITEKQVDHMKRLAGSYEALFSRRAMKYRSLGLDKVALDEKDYKKYILQEYTFLKRPVFIVEEQVFVGNAKETIESLRATLTENVE